MRATEPTPAADPRRDPLTINCDLVEPLLVGFVRSELRRVGFTKAVLGLSGGIDSPPTLGVSRGQGHRGPENVCGVRMPYSTSSSETMDHGALVAETLGIRMMTVPIYEQIDAYFAHDPDASRLRRANKMARERMTILYDQSAAQDALVIGTSNKTELLIGYRDDPRRHGLGGSNPISATSTRPRSAPCRPTWASPPRSSRSTRPPTSGSARRTRPSWASPTPRSTASSPDSSTSGPGQRQRADRRRRLRPGLRRLGSPG